MPPHESKLESAPTFTLGEIANRLGGRLDGPAEKLIRGVRPVTAAGPEDITFLDNPRYLPRLAESRAGAVVLPLGNSAVEGIPFVRVEQPYVAFAELLEMFHPRRRSRLGVSREAHVDPSASIGSDSSIYPGAYVGPGVSIGQRTDIFPGVFVGEGVEIGADCVLYPGVAVYAGCKIGDRVILHAGAVIGADGFGYAQQRNGGDPGQPVVHRKIPQLGIVIIEDDVEIGANSTIDRATMDETRICRGTKIDNLVMVAHNCRVGEHSILVAQAGISGSTTLGRYVTVAGQAGLVGHIKVGDRVTIGAQAGVTNDVPAGKSVLGSPAIDAAEAKRVLMTMTQLPKLRRRLAEIEKRLERIEGKGKGAG
jgi:UDP-3-O-[3-hydroxymyristoyl] glucosamine N-acyltransferase